MPTVSKHVVIPRMHPINPSELCIERITLASLSSATIGTDHIYCHFHTTGYHQKLINFSGANASELLETYFGNARRIYDSVIAQEDYVNYFMANNTNVKL